MRLVDKFKKGTHITVSASGVSDVKMNDFPALRAGIDIMCDEAFPLPYPIEADIRGKPGIIVDSYLKYGEPRCVVEIQYEKGRNAHFLVPADILDVSNVPEAS